MAWILIVVIIGIGSPNSASFAGEYGSQRACEAAAVSVRAAVSKHYREDLQASQAKGVVTVCTPKQ